MKRPEVLVGLITALASSQAHAGGVVELLDVLHPPFDEDVEEPADVPEEESVPAASTAPLEPPSAAPAVPGGESGETGAHPARGEGLEVVWRDPESGFSFALSTDVPGDKTLVGTMRGNELVRLDGWLAPSETDTVGVAIGGLVANETYYLYVDGYEAPTTVVADAAGSVTTTVSGTESHRVWIQITTSTIVLDAGTCSTYGEWDSGTCALTTDIADTIAISESGLTLDCRDPYTGENHEIHPPEDATGTWYDGDDLRYVGIYIGPTGRQAASDAPSGVEVRNCRVHDFATAQIDVYRATDVVLAGNELYDDPSWTTPPNANGPLRTGHGIQIVQGERIELEGNRLGQPIEDAEGDWVDCLDGGSYDNRLGQGVHVQFSSAVTVRDIRIGCPRWEGFVILESAVDVEDVVVWDASAGLNVLEGSQVSVGAGGGECRISDGRWDGIIVPYDFYGVRRHDAELAVDGCLLERNKTGLNAWWAARAEVRNTQVVGSAYNGMVIYGGEAVIEGSTFESNGHSGLWLPRGRAEVAGSTFVDNGYDGISTWWNNEADTELYEGTLTADDITVSGNNTGVYVLWTDATLTSSTVVENRYNGVAVDTGTLEATGVTASRNGHGGIWSSASELAVTASFLEDNALYNGLLVLDGVATVATTRMAGNPHNGIYSVESSVAVSGSTFLGNNNGIWANDSTLWVSDSQFENVYNGVAGNNDDAHISGSTFTGHYHNPVWAWQGRVDVDDCDFVDDARGVTADGDGSAGSFGSRVTDSRFTNIGGGAYSEVAIYFLNTEQVTILGNTIMESGQRGIDLLDVQRAWIEGNTVIDGGQFAIRLRNADDSDLVGNTLGVIEEDAEGNPIDCWGGATGADLRLDDVDDVRVRGNRIACGRNNNVYAPRLNGALFEDNLLYGSGNGLRVNRGSAVEVIDSRSLVQRSDGYRFERVDGATVRGTACDAGDPPEVLIADVGLEGIRAWGTQTGGGANRNSGLTVDCVRIERAGDAGIAAMELDGVSIDRIESVGNDNWGIYQRNTPGARTTRTQALDTGPGTYGYGFYIWGCDDCLFEDVTVSGATRDGIALVEADGATLRGTACDLGLEPELTVGNAAWDGIYVLWSSDLELDCIGVSGAGDYGIDLYYDYYFRYPNFRVRRSRVSDSGLDGITMRNVQAAQVSDTAVTGSGQRANGRGLYVGSCSGCDFSGLQVAGNALEGMQMFGSNGTLTGSRFEYNGGHGAALGAGPYAVTDNDFAGNGRSGLFLYSLLGNTTANDNAMTGNAEGGLFVWGGNARSLSGNYASGNGADLLLFGGYRDDYLLPGLADSFFENSAWVRGDVGGTYGSEYKSVYIIDGVGSSITGIRDGLSVALIDTVDARITDARLESGLGLNLLNADGTTVEDSLLVVTENPLSALWGLNSSGVTVERSSFQAPNIGVTARGDSTDWTVRDNVVRSSYLGYDFGWADGFVIEGNLAEDSMTGFSLRGPNMVVSGNVARNNLWDGFELYPWGDALIAGNTATGNGWFSRTTASTGGWSGFLVYIDPGAPNVRFVDNTASDNGYAGLWLTWGYADGGVMETSAFIDNCRDYHRPNYWEPPCADVIVQAGGFRWSGNTIGSIGFNGDTPETFDHQFDPDNVFLDPDQAVVLVDHPNQVADDPSLNGKHVIVASEGAVVRGIEPAELTIIGADRAVVDDVSITGGGRILCGGSDDVTIQGVLVEGATAWGVEALGCENLTVTESTLTYINQDPWNDPEGGCMRVVSSPRLAFLDNLCGWSRHTGLEISAGSDDFFVEGSTFTDITDVWGSYPLSIEASHGVVRDNDFEGNGWLGEPGQSWVDESWGHITDGGVGNVWEDNRLVGNNMGIRLSEYDREPGPPTLIRRNEFRGTGFVAVDVDYGPVGGVEITDNLFVENTEAIYVWNAYGPVLVRGNTILIGPPEGEAWYTGALAVRDAWEGLDVVSNVVQALSSDESIYGVSTSPSYYYSGPSYRFVDNFFYTPYNASGGRLSHTWSDQPVRACGTSIVHTPQCGGNYWAQPDGQGFSQLCDDLDWDGFCDTPYVIGPNNVDWLPLTAGRLLEVCHVTPLPRAAPVDLWITEAALAAHLDHGDTQGPCPDGL